MIPPQFSLDGRAAPITGSGRGIGLGMARALAAVGCAVAIQDIDRAVAEAEAHQIVDGGGKAIALGGDICDLSVAGTLVDETLAKLGRLDILINNAAIQAHKSWLECSPAEIQREWGANLITPILLCQLAVPIFKAQRWGASLILVPSSRGGATPTCCPTP